MAKIITAKCLKALWPRASGSLISAVTKGAPDIFARYGLTTPLRVAHFMAQISHESDGGTITAENLSYSTASRIAAVWPTRFTVASAEPYVHNPKALASKVYNGRMGNVAGTDDGYDYRGRGLLQITGRASYREMGRITGLDLEGDPDLAFDPDHALEIAAAEFQKLNCLSACDADDVTLVTKRVNGGYNGLASRKVWLSKWKIAIAEIPDTANDLRVAMGGQAPRVADPAAPEKSMLSSTEGNAALGGGALGFMQTMNDMGSQVRALKETGESFGFADLASHLAISPQFLIGAGIIAACGYIWFRRRWRLRIETA